MAAPLPAPDPAPSCRYGTPDDFAMHRIMTGAAAFLGGTANVIMQLAHRPVAYGVLESTVDSGKLTVHPFKRLRTTLTYLAVALMGTEDERAAYRAAVNTSHRSIRSTPQSPVRYNAFDPELQLWVAACLYQGVVDIERRMHGEWDEATADVFHLFAARLGTSLQMRPELWPADRAAFAAYWRSGLAACSIDDRTRAYLTGLIDLTMLPRPLRLFAPLQRFVVTGLLPPELRAEMQLPWSPRRERLLAVLLRTVGAVTRAMPSAVRLFPMNYFLADFRRRRRLGRPLV
ncbi:oxygenase MpaB family protein [Nocardia sp. NPDC057353]|uniref:oxygenase MpaB family protein n=1 Tax=Nocardia sp. NPDC057353 TaxID=3346104 RepID=UPI003645CDF9